MVSAVGTFNVPVQEFTVESVRTSAVSNFRRDHVYDRRQTLQVRGKLSGLVARRRWTLRFSQLRKWEELRLRDLFELTVHGSLLLNFAPPEGGASVLVRMSQPFTITWESAAVWSATLVLEEQP